MRLSDWFTDIHQVHRYMHDRLIGWPITTDNGKICLSLVLYSGYRPRPWGITLTYNDKDYPILVGCVGSHQIANGLASESHHIRLFRALQGNA